MITVAVVGSVNTDLVVEVPRLPVAGETVLGSDMQVQPGGKGANQAIAAARLGARVSLFAATGDDDFGARVRAVLADEALDVSQVATIANVPTGTALIVVDPDGRNMITVAPGANHRLTESHLASLRHPGVAVVLLQLEIPLATCREAARIARQAGARVVLNAAPLHDPHDPVLTELLPDVDVLVVNEGEARQLTGQPSPGDLTGWAGVAAGLRKLGPDAVVVTLGERGAVAAEDGATYQQQTFDVAAVDTTGAGDAFCGALAVRLAHADPLPDAVRVACAAGALATTRIGAQSGLPTQAELDRLLDPRRSH